MKATNGERRVAVVGAGPAGLVNARFLAEHGFEPEIFESSESLGGQWNSDAPHSGVWPSMVTNTSALMTCFSDLPHLPETAVYATNRQMLAYLHRYAEHFRLERCIRLGTRLEHIERGSGGWALRIARPNGAVAIENFPRVVIATGRYRRPIMAPVRGLGEFTGCGGAIHAFRYKQPERFRGLRVLVGGSNISGLEIASDLASLGAARVVAAARRQRYILLKLLAGVPHDQIGLSRFGAHAQTMMPAEIAAEIRKAFVLRTCGSPEQYGAPRPHPNVFVAGVGLSQHFLPLVAEGRITVRPWISDINGNRVAFEDGSSEEVDAIVFGTGYALDLPFLDREIGAILDLNAQHADLYEYTFHPDLDGLAFAGLYELNGPYFPSLELQARWIAHVWAGVIPAPTPERMRAGIASYRSGRGLAQARPSNVISLLFSRAAGVEPDARHWPTLARALWFGPLSSVSFRLDGPGRLSDAAERYQVDATSCGAVPSPEFAPEQRRLLQTLATYDPVARGFVESLA